MAIAARSSDCYSPGAKGSRTMAALVRVADPMRAVSLVFGLVAPIHGQLCHEATCSRLAPLPRGENPGLPENFTAAICPGQRRPAMRARALPSLVGDIDADERMFWLLAAYRVCRSRARPAACSVRLSRRDGFGVPADMQSGPTYVNACRRSRLIASVAGPTGARPAPE